MTTTSTYSPHALDDRWSAPPRYVLLVTLGLASILLTLSLMGYQFHLSTSQPDRAFAAFVLVGIQLPAFALQLFGHAIPSIFFLTRHGPPAGPATSLALLAWIPPVLTLATLSFALGNLLCR